MLNSILNWILINVVDLIQSFGIILSLLFAGYQIMVANRFNRFSTRLTLTQSHKELWSLTISNPELSRFDNKIVDIKKEPVTESEETFGLMLIAHINLAYHANKEGLMKLPAGYKDDIRELLSLPIPNTIWNDAKSYQEKDFTLFIDKLLSKEKTSIASKLARLKEKILPKRKKSVKDKKTSKRKDK